MLLLTITLETGISLNIYIYSIFALIMVIGRSMVDNDGLVVATLVRVFHGVAFRDGRTGIYRYFILPVLKYPEYNIYFTRSVKNKYTTGIYAL